MLTLAEFNNTHERGIIDGGTIKDSPDGINMTNSGKELRWVAIKGYANDWCIYLHWSSSSVQDILDHGDKVHGNDNILKLVPCVDEVLDRYKH